MRSMLIRSCIFASLLLPLAHVRAETIQLSYNPAIGTRWETIVESSNATEQSGKPPRRMDSRTVYGVTVDGRHDNGFRATVTVLESSARSSGYAGIDPAALLTEHAKGLTLVTLIDETGMPVGLENEAEVRAWLRKILTDAPKVYPDIPNAAEPAKMIMASLDRLPTAELIAMLAGGDVLIAQAMNKPLETGAVQTYGTEIKVPFPSLPMVKAEGRFVLKSNDHTAGTALINWSESLDPEDAKRATLEGLRAMFGPTAPQERVEAAAATMTARQRIEADGQIALEDGTLRRLEYRRVFSLGDALKQVTARTIIARKLP